MNRRDLEMQVQELFEGNLGEEAMRDLERELWTNPEARDCYREYLHLHNALRFRAKGVDLLNVVPLSRRRSVVGKVWGKRAGIAAAVALVLGVGTGGFLLNRFRSPLLTFETSPGSDVSVSREFASGSRPAAGKTLEPGSRLQVRSGTMELEFPSGVRGVIRGPAELTLYREDLLQLERGVAWFRVPPAADGFKVSTPDLVVDGKGAEFGVVADPAFLSEVHVLGGNVAVMNLKGRTGWQKLEAGQARAAGPEEEGLEVPVRPNRFLTSLPPAEPEPNLIVTKESSPVPQAYADQVSAFDLLQGIQPITTGWNLRNDARPEELTDGIHGHNFEEIPGDIVQGAWTTVGATAEYHLGTGPKGGGYDLTSIRSIADWENVGFGNQAWTLEVKPVNGDWRTLTSVAYGSTSAQPLAGGGATIVTVTAKNGVLASGIEAIKVIAGRMPGSVDNAFVWRELDVFGQAAAARPVSKGDGKDGSAKGDL